MIHREFVDENFKKIQILFLECLADALARDAITPNGRMVPGKETYYTQLQEAVLQAFRNCVNTPFKLRDFNIRWVSGVPDLVATQRPKATTKLHTDIWNGESPHDTAVFLGICGDFKAAGVSFFEAPHLTPEWYRFLNDYDEGAGVLADLKPLGELHWREFTLMEMQTIHCTHKNGPGFRGSVDFRVQPSFF